MFPHFDILWHGHGNRSPSVSILKSAWEWRHQRGDRSKDHYGETQSPAPGQANSNTPYNKLWNFTFTKLPSWIQWDVTIHHRVSLHSNSQGVLKTRFGVCKLKHRHANKRNKKGRDRGGREAGIDQGLGSTDQPRSSEILGKSGPLSTLLHAFSPETWGLSLLLNTLCISK